nr:CPBP family intramembrane glutamic endopeptidase [Pseudenhygromyxa sp. WMMC2535]
MASAAGSYYALERLRAKQGEDHTADPLVPREDRKGGLASALLVPLFVLAALVGSATLGWLQEAIFGAKVAEQEVIVALVERGDVFELAFLASVAVILAPLTEELLFRHMFFRRLRHSAGAQLAWVLPAVAFAVSHWNPIGLAIYTWLGLVFAFAYLYTGRFWVAVAVHAGHNALALAMLVWFPQELASG